MMRKMQDKGVFINFLYRFDLSLSIICRKVIIKLIFDI